MSKPKLLHVGLQRLGKARWLLLVLAVSFALPSHRTPNATAWQNPQPASAEEERVRAEIRDLEGLLPRVPDRGAALYLLAKRYARLREMERAFALLKECVALDEGFDPEHAPDLQPLSARPGFRALVERVHRRYPIVHRARVAFTVPETDLFPEGLAADPTRGLFFMGSMHRRKIIRIMERGEVSDFVRPDLYNLMPVGGLKVDPADHGLWACTDPGELNRSELVHFDSNGRLLERYPAPGPGPHDLNDLVIRNGDEIYVTDTFAHQVYRFDRRSHIFEPLALAHPVAAARGTDAHPVATARGTDTRRLFYPNGISVSGDAGLLYIADLLGVLRVDLRDKSAADVNPGGRSTLAGIDGLYWYKGDLLGVQYGTTSYRVARFRLSPDGRRVRQTEILENRTPLISFPTTGAIAGGRFYFIANTGIGNLRNDAIVDPGKLEPVNIAVVALR